MLATITTTSQSLKTILGDTNIGIINNNLHIVGPSRYSILIQNLGTQDIYIDFGATATTTGGIRIRQDEFFSFSLESWSICNLISDGSNNTNVRIISKN